MSFIKNLIPGQYQIGNLVFGRGTNITVDSFDIKPYDINQQDHQVSRNDEVRFGMDQFKPTTIEITMHVLNNKLIHPYENLIPNFWANMPTVSDIHEEWRADNIRQTWGAMKPLYFCGKDGITRVIYGRPGQFTYAKDTERTEAIQILAQFRCGDTLSYTAQEAAVLVDIGNNPLYLTRETGNADAWFRVIIVGPATNPIITIGDQEIKLSDVTIANGDAVEISSYPWRRRVVNNNGVNLTANISGKTKYLDKLKIAPFTETAIRWTSAEYNTWTLDYGNDETWSQNIDTLHFEDLPVSSARKDSFHQNDISSSYFTAISGRVKLQLEVLWNPTRLKQYLLAGRGIYWGQQAAVIYNKVKFNTNNQYCEAKIARYHDGRSGLVIMSNQTMTNFAMIEVQSSPTKSENYLHIRTGSSYNNISSPRSSYNHGDYWKNDDIVGIGYDPATNTYQAYLNREIVTTWTDSNHVVNTSSSNRFQGIIFNCDAEQVKEGCGFRDILAYDRASSLNQNPTGQCVLLWQDAWSSIT